MLQRICISIFSAFVVGATSVSAQAPEIAGSFSYAPDLSDNIDKAINAGIQDMLFVIRPIARSRLRKTNVPDKALVFKQTIDTVIFTDDSGKPVSTPNNGAGVDYVFDGETMKLSTLAKDGKIVQTYDAKDGKRVNTYRMRPDGHLAMDVVITSPQLPAPIQYTLVYRRSR